MRFFLPLALLLFLVSIPGASYAALNTQPASAAAEQTNEAPEPLLNQDGPLIAPENNIPLAEPLAPAAPAPAVSSAVVVRVGRHPEFIRFSFDWPENVDYTVKVSDTKVILQFSKAGDLNSQPFSKILGDGISDVAAYKEDGKLKVVFTLIKPAQGRWFKDGKTVALDILAPQASAEKPPAKAPEVKAEPPKPEPEPAKAEAPPPEAPEVKAQPKSASPYPPEKAAPREAVDGQQLQHDAPRELVNKPAVPLSLQRGEKTVSLKFSWDKLPGAAVFQRAGYVWIVFDQDADFVLDAVAQNVAKVLGKVETISLNGGVALRLQSIPGLELALGNDPKNFEIIMRKKGGVPNVALKIDTLTDENGRPYLYLSAGVEVKRLFTITDPEVGDQFLVAPLSKYGLGVNGLREYAPFRLLPTIQGIVMQSFSDQVAMMPQALGVEIASKQGLAITPPPSAEAPEKMASEEEYGPPIPTAAEMDRPVLDFAGWQRGKPSSFLSIERQLWQKIVSLPLKERSAARFDLAAFYFAHGWMSEALSILKTIVQEDEAFARDLNFIAIYGVASLLNGDVKTADDYLKDPRFDDKRDIIMWRAVVAAEQRDYLAAAEQFKRAGEENPAIPSDLRRAILRLKLNALIESEDFDGLEQAIVAYQKSPDASLFRNEWQYWKGLMLALRSEYQQAQEVLKPLLKQEDPWLYTRSELTLIKYGLESEAIKRDEAIARLERLRFAWRGDAFEYKVLVLLGRLQLEEGRWRDGMRGLRRALSMYPSEPGTHEVLEQLGDAFKKLFLEGGVNEMPPLTQLAMFDEFRELTPTGPEGDEIIRSLVDRLVAVDLLPRAAELLEHQVNFRLNGIERTKVANRLALIYLLDRKPEAAVKALDLSNSPDMDEALQQERRLLRARALFMQNQTNQALPLILNDPGHEADLLRADIYWRLRNWSLAARSLAKVIGETAVEEKLSEDQAQQILNLAVATSLSGDIVALKTIRERYRDMMKPTSKGEAFNIVTDIERGQTNTIDDLTQKLASVKEIESFMNTYMTKIKQGGLSKIN